MNKYIKKALCYSVISALFLTETSIASVYELMKVGNLPAEVQNNVVVDGDKIKVRGPEGFKKLVENLYTEGTPPTRGQEENAGQQKIRNYNKLPTYLKAGKRVGVGDEQNSTVENKHQGKYTPANSANCTKDHASGFYEFDSQMLGAAVWVPDNNTNKEQQVYVAKKIRYERCEKYGYKKNGAAVTTGYNGENHETFKKRTDIDHTERQLVAAILSEKNINGGDSGDAGTMCIYTKGHPCLDDRAAAAGEISCVNYYKKLTGAYKNIKFHVYFSKNNDITENDIKTIERKVRGPVGNLYEYECFKSIAKTDSLPRYFRQRQNTAFNFQFKYDSVYLRYLLNHLNGHKMAGNGCEVKKVGELYNIRITYGSNGSLTFDKIRSAEDITSYNSLQAIVNHIGGIEATGQSCLSPEGGHISPPIIPINDFNKAYNDDRKISAENNLEFEPLDLT